MTFPSLLLALAIALSLDAIEQIRCVDGAGLHGKVNFPRKLSKTLTVELLNITTDLFKTGKRGYHIIRV